MPHNTVLTFHDGGIELASKPVFRLKVGFGNERSIGKDYADLLDQGYRQVDPDILPEGASVYAVRNSATGSRWVLATVSRRS